MTPKTKSRTRGGRTATPRDASRTVAGSRRLPDTREPMPGSRLLMIGLTAFVGACTVMMPTPSEAPLRVEGVMRVSGQPTPADLAYREGRQAINDGRRADAAERFRHALSLDPAHIESYNGLGVALSLENKPQEAIEVLNAGLTLAPTASHLHANLGLAYYMLSRLDEAKASLEKAAAGDPDNPRVKAVLERIAALRPVPTAADKVIAEQRTRKGKPAFTVITGAQNDRRLIQIAPNVFELRDPIDSRLNSRETSVADLGGEASQEIRRLQQRAIAASQAAKRVGPIRGFEVTDSIGEKEVAWLTARHLSRHGMAPERVTADNAPYQPVLTEIHYRKGYAEQVRRIQKSLPVKTYSVELQQLDPKVNVRLHVGRDLAGQAVAMKPAPRSSRSKAAVAGPATVGQATPAVTAPSHRS